MVVRRTIEHMKTRPRDEQLAFAGTVAFGVMFVLFIGWTIFFFSSLRASAPPASETATSTVEQF